MSTELTQVEHTSPIPIKKRRKKKRERLQDKELKSTQSTDNISQESMQPKDMHARQQNIEIQNNITPIKNSTRDTTSSKATLSIDAVHNALLDVVENSTVYDFERFELNAGGFQNALVLYSIISNILLHNGLDTLTEQQINQIIKSKGLDLPEFVISKQCFMQNTSTELDDYYIPYILEPALHFAIIVVIIDIVLFGTSTSFCAYLSTLINSTIEGTFLIGNYYVSIKGLYCLLLGIFNIISFSYVYHRMIAVSKKEVIQ